MHTPGKVLLREAFAEPHRIIADAGEQDNRDAQLLTRTLVDHLRYELTKAAPVNDLGP